MAFRLGIVGAENTGKSFSRSFIPDGENVLIIAPSNKATWLTNSQNITVGPLDIQTPKVQGWEQAQKLLKLPSQSHVIKYIMDEPTYVPGVTLKRANLPGNIIVLKHLTHLPIWLDFADKYMPWIHTIILPDFTHFISEIISQKTFIEKKHGSEAYQKFWELAADALQSFILKADTLRRDLIIVTEYHSEYIETLGSYSIFSSGGKMLNEKFKPASYYDVMLYTTTGFNDEGIVDSFQFVTKPTRVFPQARCLDLFKEAYIPNNLQEVLTRLRVQQNLPIVPYVE